MKNVNGYEFIKFLYEVDAIRFFPQGKTIDGRLVFYDINYDHIKMYPNLLCEYAMAFRQPIKQFNSNVIFGTWHKEIATEEKSLPTAITDVLNAEKHITVAIKDAKMYKCAIRIRISKMTDDIFFGADNLRAGSVILVDDQINDDTFKNAELIKSIESTVMACIVAFDTEELNCSNSVFSEKYGVPVTSLATFSDLMNFMQSQATECNDSQQLKIIEGLEHHKKMHCAI